MLDFAKKLTDHSDLFLHKLIHWIGGLSIFSGGVQTVATTEVGREAIPVIAQVCPAPDSITSTIVAVCTSLGALAYAYYNLTNARYRKIEHKKVMSEKRTDRDTLSP